jgi:hypothetical protein
VFARIGPEEKPDSGCSKASLFSRLVPGGQFVQEGAQASRSAGRILELLAEQEVKVQPFMVTGPVGCWHLGLVQTLLESCLDFRARLLHKGDAG